MSWGEMAEHLGWGTVLEEGWRKGPWTAEEDRLLVEYVKLHGEGRWNSVATLAGLKRNGKSCRLRWVNYLRPDLKRGQITPHEENIILELHARWGNRWSTIARSLPGRTDNEIKNYWRTHFKKKAKSSSDNTEKAKARLLRRQQIQQQQQQQQLQQQQMNQLAEIKRIMSSLLEENDDKLAPSSLAPPQMIMREDMEIVYPNNTASDDDHHREQQGFLYPPFNNNGYASHHVTPNQPHQEDNIFWDGLWNLDDIHGSNLISMPFAVPNRAGLHNLVTPSSFY